ncbi:MAG: hypothetical protein Q4E55_03580, partial [Bacteroidales bacterium]|nr:hypothetical protein [Bacteroidales bacterium]
GRLALTGKEFKLPEYVEMTARYDGTNYTTLKWATCNLGASSPSDYGDYYAWGETEPYYYYSEDGSLVWKPNRENGYDCQSYCRNEDFVEWRTAPYDGNKILKPEYDAARQNWGGSWRMPTKQEFQALVDDCDWDWITEGGHKGYKVTDTKGHSIFLPAAGLRYGSMLLNEGGYGYYWSSSLSTSNSGSASHLYFSGGYHNVSDLDDRYLGRSVRPVRE